MNDQCAIKHHSKEDNFALFKRVLSHDLRAPLRHVIAYSNILQEMIEQGEDVTQALETLNESSRKIGLMIDSLVDLAHIFSVSLQITKISAEQLIQEARKELHKIAPKKDLERKVDWNINFCNEEYNTKIDNSVFNGCAISIDADLSLLRLALRNIFANALKFTRYTPHPIITVNVEQISSKYIKICTIDNGIGFNDANSIRLFDPFVRLHASSFEGVGASLAQVRAILLRHGGYVKASSNHGKGFEICCYLPMLKDIKS